MLVDKYQPTTINLSGYLERGPLGRFRAAHFDLRDANGRKLVVVDLLEVERRLKARTTDE